MIVTEKLNQEHGQVLSFQTCMDCSNIFSEEEHFTTLQIKSIELNDYKCFFISFWLCI